MCRVAANILTGTFTLILETTMTGQISKKMLRCSLCMLLSSAIACAQNVDLAAQKQASKTAEGKTYVDFRDYGAVGGGRADDTAAANSTISALAGSGGLIRFANSTPNFWMKLTAPVNLSNKAYYTLLGPGAGAGFAYCGDGSGPVINMDRSYYDTLRDFSIIGHWRDNCSPTPAKAGILWDRAKPGNWNASGLYLDRVWITGAQQGDMQTPNFTCIDISPVSQVNVEDGKIYNVVCNPSGGIGFHIGPSANPKNEIFFNNNVSFGQYGYKFEAGGYHIKYGECGNHSQACLYLAGANDPASIDGLLSEANKQFLRLGAGFGHHPITVSHVNNGWDDKATAPCFWDIGGSEYFLAFSNTWSDTFYPTPHALCGNQHSSGIFINNSFAWKLFGSNAPAQYYQYLPPPNDLLELLGSGYAFHGGGQIALGTTAAGAVNGVSFIQTTGSLRSGLRYSTDSTAKTTGAMPVGANHVYLGDGVLEIAGPGAPYMDPGCTVRGGDTSQHYGVWLFALDSAKRRTVEGHAFGCHGPKLQAIDGQHTFSLRWTPQPEAASYDVVLLVDGILCFVGNTADTSLTVHARPACNNYKFPRQNEAEYIRTRGRGIWGFGPASETTPTWFIDTASGSASFSGGVNAAKLQGIADRGVVANLNADRVDGKHASDFTAAPLAPPEAATSPCTAGGWAYDASFVYVCVGKNSWKRAALSTW